MDIEANKYRLICELELCERDTAGIRNWLCKSDFFQAPASTRFHLSEVGGLCQHSINVFNRLEQINQCLDLSIDQDSIRVCGLLHDICKAHFYKVEKRNKKIDGKWQEVDTFVIDDRFPIGHGEKSVIILQKYIDLTPDEAIAIRWHMGAYNESYQCTGTMSSALKISKLPLALQMADQAASFWDEREVV